jgi:hypothetical protein
MFSMEHALPAFADVKRKPGMTISALTPHTRNKALFNKDPLPLVSTACHLASPTWLDPAVSRGASGAEGRHAAGVEGGIAQAEGGADAHAVLGQRGRADLQSGGAGRGEGKGKRRSQPHGMRRKRISLTHRVGTTRPTVPRRHKDQGFRMGPHE